MYKRKGGSKEGMSGNFDQDGQYIFIALGIYCVIKGFMIITTGKLSAAEESRIRDYSPKGIQRDKGLSAITNIIGGILTIGISVVKMMNLMDSNVFRIVALIVIVVLVAIFFVIRNSCKKV